MSLRNKINLLFLVLAILPLLLLAAFSYWHVQNMLRTTVTAEMERTASRLSQSLFERTEEIEEELASLPGTIQAGTMEAAKEVPSPPKDHKTRADSAFSFPEAVFLRFRDSVGRVSYLKEPASLDPYRCTALGESRLVELSAHTSWQGRSGVLSAGVWASDLLPFAPLPAAASIRLVKPGTKEVLFSGYCQMMPDSAGIGSIREWDMPWDRFLTQESGEWSAREGDEAILGAYASVPGRGWTVMATTSPTPVLSPLSSMFAAYWIFVLALAVFTMVAFSMLLRKFTRSLQELSRAAEEIGLGELDPWLPLPTSGEVGQLTLAFSRMLARIRQMMAKVDQSGRMAVVGQLSAYLAHEIRNPLSSIKLNLQRLQRWVKNGAIPDFCLEPVEISLKEVERLNASVTGVLELSSAPNAPLEVVCLHDLVREAADLLGNRFRKRGVKLILELDAEGDRVTARAGQLKSVILNLMVNALEAQPEGGVLHIRSVLSRARGDGDPVVALHFKDEGPGIPAELRGRVFEPFFSTKPGGSGIGLAMASQAVQDCMGDLYLEPALTKESGAEFVVALPLAAVQIRPYDEAWRSSVKWQGLAKGWGRPPTPGSRGSESGDERATHLMSPEGLDTLFSSSKKGEGEVA